MSGLPAACIPSPGIGLPSPLQALSLTSSSSDLTEHNMAEPLGTVASVLSVLKLALAATEYVKGVKQGSSDRLRLRDELRSTTCLLEMLKDRIEDSEDDAEHGAEILKPSSIASLTGEDGPLGLFKRVLEEIIAKLAPQDRLRRLARPFKWPFDKKEITELVSALERLKSHFNLVMQNDLVYDFLISPA